MGIGRSATSATMGIGRSAISGIIWIGASVNPATTWITSSEISATEWGGSKGLWMCCGISSSAMAAAPPLELDAGPDGRT